METRRVDESDAFREKIYCALFEIYPFRSYCIYTHHDTRPSFTRKFRNIPIYPRYGRRGLGRETDSCLPNLRCWTRKRKRKRRGRKGVRGECIIYTIHGVFFYSSRALNRNSFSNVTFLSSNEEIGLGYFGNTGGWSLLVTYCDQTNSPRGQ